VFLFLACTKSEKNYSGTATDVHTGSIAGTLQFSPDDMESKTKLFLYEVDIDAATSSLSKKQLNLAPSVLPFDSIEISEPLFEFKNIPVGNWQIEAFRNEIRVGVSEPVRVEANQIVNITIVINIIVQQFITINNYSNTLIINEASLGGGRATIFENGVSLELASDMIDTLWVHIDSGDSVLGFPIILEPEEDGNWVLDLSKVLADIDVSIQPTMSSSNTFSSSSPTVSSSSGVATITDYCPTIGSSSFYEFIDERDANIYPCTQIGNQVWMKENLRYDPPGMDDDFCIIPDYCEPGGRGRLYVYNSLEVNQLCPAGWRIPSYDDWAELADSIEQSYGLSPGAGGTWAGVSLYLKIADQGIWSGTAQDSLGFSALPSGYREPDGTWPVNGEVHFAWFWSSTKLDSQSAMAVQITAQDNNLNMVLSDVLSGFGVRCIAGD
jgi:uncharacterized protein (TIGR02145 family)